MVVGTCADLGRVGSRSSHSCACHHLGCTIMSRNFDLTPSSGGKLGEVSPEASLLLSPDNRDFIAGIFAGVVLAAGPLIVLALVFLNLD
jgi:hypothetical protein